jgi:hypothetical protein
MFLIDAYPAGVPFSRPSGECRRPRKPISPRNVTGKPFTCLFKTENLVTQSRPGLVISVFSAAYELLKRMVAVLNPADEYPPAFFLILRLTATASGPVTPSSKQRHPSS